MIVLCVKISPLKIKYIALMLDFPVIILYFRNYIISFRITITLQNIVEKNLKLPAL